MQTAVPLRTNRNDLAGWSLNKLIVGILTAGFVMLVADLRSEHVDAVRHDWKAWIPIAYSAVMFVMGIIGLMLWDRGGRQVLLALFCAAFIVGTLGFWFHNAGHPVTAVLTVLGAWRGSLHHEDVPPPLAPLAFAGIGLLGVLACARHTQPRAASIS